MQNEKKKFDAELGGLLPKFVLRPRGRRQRRWAGARRVARHGHAALGRTGRKGAQAGWHWGMQAGGASAAGARGTGAGRTA